MSELVARTFVVLFFLAYFVMIVTMLGWALRKWFNSGDKESRTEAFLSRLRHWRSLDRPRKIH